MSKNYSIKDILPYFEKTGFLAGGEPDLPFEQAFGSLAHAYISDKAPKLLDYEIGFQLLKKSPDNTKAAGIFGFQVGKSLLMIPVFFINGDLKGHELLYIKNNDVFVPLTENWVNYLLGRKPILIGDGVEKNLRNLGVTPPYLRNITRPPLTKFSSDKRIYKWAKDYFLNDIRKIVYNSRLKNEELFKNFLTKNAETAVPFILEKIAQEHPTFLSAIDHFYPGLIDNLVSNIASRQKRANSVLNVLHENKNKNTEKLKIYDLAKIPSYDVPSLNLSKKDKFKLLLDGLLIKDARDKEEKSKVYINEPVKFNNPTESGLYDVVFSPYVVHKCVVLIYPQQLPHRSTVSFVLKLNDKDKIESVYPLANANIFVTKTYSKEQFRKWFDSLPEKDVKTIIDNNKDSQYFLINNEAESIGPFYFDSCNYQDHYEDESDCCEEIYDPDTKEIKKQKTNYPITVPVCFYDYPINSRESDSSVNLSGILNHKSEYTKRDHYFKDYYYGNQTSAITFLNHKGNKLKIGRKSINVPRGFKLIEINKDQYKFNNGQIFANAVSVQFSLNTYAAPYRVSVSGNVVQINGKEMSRKSAIISLVKDHGLGEKEAREILKTAESKLDKTIEIFITKPKSEKRAYGEPLGDLARSGVIAPDIPEFGPVYSDAIGAQGYPVQISEPMFSSIVDPNVQQLPPNPFDPAGVDPRLLQSAQQAAELGQKEVFDVAALATLLNSANEDIIDKFLGDLMKGLDRLGRILFLLYWHRDVFEERYGKSDLPEIEDALRNTFLTTGDVLLKLKSKSINPLSNTGLNIDLSSIASM